MNFTASKHDEYIDQIPEDRKEAMQKLRGAILKNLPEEFEEGINYGMLGYYGRQPTSKKNTQ
ncbi:MAG TPA: hypothetical protein ENK75_06660 [Saprospiraceae bacterium]|nr:hypothetical protein [Saprospiraceae bacterium]HHH55445.1 hypothetical protein [Bacteroidota bacterium]